MPIVNLRNFDYRELKKNIYVEVSDEVAQGLLELRRAEDRVRRKICYHKAYFSLDFYSDVEKEALDGFLPSPEELWLEKEQEAYDELMKARLVEAMTNTLTPIQAKRIHALYMDKKRITRIAEEEGVGRGSVSASVYGGIKKLKAYFEKKQWALRGDDIT